MRVVGYFGRNRTALDRFTERWGGQGKDGEGGEVRLRLRPADAPLIAVALVEDCNPPLQWAENANGSFALLDGEVFGGANALAVGPAGRCDAAALLAAYTAKGPEAIADMNGSASLVIFDASSQSLLLFRDRLGQTPIFYSERPEGLFWASEIPSLLGIGLPGTIDHQALDFFLAAGYAPAPWTLVEEIRKVPPAHYLRRVGDSAGQTKRYWLGTGRPKLALSREEAARRIGGVVEQAVSRCYTSGSRTGVLLSGGVDSALLVGCLASQVKADIDAFTFRYGAYDGPFNEFDLAHETAVHFAIRHHAVDFGPADVSDNIERMARDYGEPFIWGIHTFALRQVAKAGISAVLSGSGADSWTIRRREDMVMRFRGLPAPLRGLVNATVPALGLLYPDLARRSGEFLRCARTGVPFSALAPVMSDAYRRRVYRDHALADRGRHAAAELLEKMRQEFTGESDRDQFLLLRQRLFFAECNLFWNHAWARASNLAIRHPYNDNDLQDLVMRLPHYRTDKNDLRRYAATILPRRKAYAPKVFHGIPLKHWFRGPLQGFLRDQLSTERLNRQGIFEPSAVGRLIDEHVAGQSVHTWRLLAMLTVTVWLDAVLRSAGSGRA